MRSFLFTVAAWSTLQILPVLAQGNPSCIADCSANLRGRFTEFACTSAEDGPCLCKSDSYLGGVRGCATESCGVSQDDANTWLGGNFCAGLLNSAPETPEDPPAPTTSQPPPDQPAEEPTQAPEVSSAPPAETTSATPATTANPATETAETSAALTTTTTLPSSTGATDSETKTKSESSSTSAPSASSTPKAGDDEKNKDENKDENNDEDESGGMSQGAVAGLAVGVTAVALALIGVAIFFFMRNRRAPNKRNFVEISKPLPHQGRGSGGSRDPFEEKRSDDIELTTNRYEDMVPRTQPRIMV